MNNVGYLGLGHVFDLRGTIRDSSGLRFELEWCILLAEVFGWSVLRPASWPRLGVSFYLFCSFFLMNNSVSLKL